MSSPEKLARRRSRIFIGASVFEVIESSFLLFACGVSIVGIGEAFVFPLPLVDTVDAFERDGRAAGRCEAVCVSGDFFAAVDEKNDSDYGSYEKRASRPVFLLRDITFVGSL